MKRDIVQQARIILARELNVNVAQLTPSAALREDLGMDSVIALNVIFAAERELEITIPEKEVVSVRTVGDLERLLVSLSGDS